MICPFDLVTELYRMCDELVSGRRKEISVTIGEEHRVAREYFDSRSIEIYDSLDTPVDVIIELA
jgi:hypothetical protein